MYIDMHIPIYVYICIHMHMYTYVHVIMLQSSVLQYSTKSSVLQYCRVLQSSLLQYSTLLLQCAFQCNAVCIAVRYRALQVCHSILHRTSLRCIQVQCCTAHWRALDAFCENHQEKSRNLLVPLMQEIGDWDQLTKEIPAIVMLFFLISSAR